MAIIKVETPQGVKDFEIAGDKPTPQEVAAIKKTISNVSSTGTNKAPTNALGNMAAGMKAGYKVGNDPLGTIGKAIGDKFDDLASGGGGKGKDKNSGDDEKMTKQGVNFMKSELGLENPNMAVKALQKLVNGDPVSNAKEREAVAPIINAVVKSLQDQNGRTRLKTLFKSIK